MEKSLNYIKLDADNSENQPFFRCSECRETFHKPIRATLSSQGYVQTYNACPRCLSKITIVKQEKSEEIKEASTLMENPKKISVAKEKDNVDCQHFLGYLKTRPKDKSIPDECLTCDKMIECMVH
jgi:DNA-directed RNA polymerase subunit RPC12/RpoP